LEGLEHFYYESSPLCYCDFFNYARSDLGHTLKPKALNINKEFSNPCGRFEDSWDYNNYNDLQKESLIEIFEKTNGRNWTNNNGWMDETVDHCQWYGISCDGDGFVTSIDLRGNNLEGQFPVYSRNEYNSDGSISPILDSHWYQSKYGLANLYKLNTLDLSNNKLTGMIEYAPLYNLNALTHFDVSGNQLSGEVEALVAPSLTHADFSNNSFTSMHRFQKYKVSPLQTLRYESLNNLQKLRQFNMAANALSGKLPGFTESFTTLQELDMSNQDETNGFTGSIPEDIWRSLSLKKLNLAGNRLTGTIPSLIGNLAVLEVFDLSNNLLESSLPPELGMLEGE